MKKIILIVLIIITTCVNAQKFEKGYFINNNGERTECFIKNVDWKNNPNFFKYKVLENDSDILEKTISDVKEFEINLSVKFIRATVKIDQSSTNEYNLSNTFAPNNREITVFLKVLVEGKSNLYFFEDEITEKYFFDVDNKIEQLIYKKYSKENGDIFQNETFKQQLFNNFKCTDDKSKILKLKYYDDLIKYFIETNNCLNSLNEKETKNFSKRSKEQINKKINFTIYNQNNLLSRGSYINITDINNSFFNQFGIGFETEITKLNGVKKWSLFFDPDFTINYLQYTKPVEYVYLISTNLIKTDIRNVNFKEQEFKIRLPIGKRFNFKLNNNQKLFLNASIILGFSYFSEQSDVSKFSNLAIYLSTSFGCGYQFKNLTAEIKYYSSPYFLDEGDFTNKFALKLGYQIFNSK